MINQLIVMAIERDIQRTLGKPTSHQFLPGDGLYIGYVKHHYQVTKQFANKYVKVGETFQCLYGVRVDGSFECAAN